MLTEAGVKQIADDARAERNPLHVTKRVLSATIILVCEQALRWKAERDELAVALADKMAVESEVIE